MRISRAIIVLSFCIFFSELCSADSRLFEQIRKANTMEDLDNQVTFTSSETSAQLDDGDVPIVNPTTPGSGMNPPTMDPPYTNPPTIFPPITVPPMTPSPNFNPSPPATTQQPVQNPPPTTTTPTSSGGSWCIANPSASQTSLQVALDYACGYGGTDCSQIQPGATCFEPNTLKDHASFAFNDYYHKNPAPTSCAFGGAAQLTNTDPSHGNCKYSSSSGGASPSPPMTAAPTPPSPPSITPPINPYTPAGPTGYGSDPTDFGSEPTGTPSGGISITYHQSLLSTFMLLLAAGIYI